MTAPRILVIDDEPQLVRALRTTLTGPATTWTRRRPVQEALAAASFRPPDVILLDLVLPDIRARTSVASCAGGARCRSWSCRRSGTSPKIAALDAGADDYVTKPFAIGELLARLRAVLRRAGPNGEPLLDIGSLHVDLEKHAVTVDGEPVHLTPHEFDLLSLLARNKGKLLTHRMILKEVWGPAYQLESSYLHVYVSQLRRKIEPDPARPRYLITETGVGYRLVDPDLGPLDRS